jgi:hypothetical protein
MRASRVEVEQACQEGTEARADLGRRTFSTA